MIKKLLLLSATFTLLCSCITARDTTELVILQHPETMDFQDCRLAEWGSEKAIRENEECVQRYQRLGYIVWGQR